MGGVSQKEVDEMKQANMRELERRDKLAKERAETQRLQYEKAMKLQEELQEKLKKQYEQISNLIKKQEEEQTTAVAKEVAKQTKEQNKVLLIAKEELLADYTKMWKKYRTNYLNHLKKHEKIEFTLKDETSKLQKKFTEKSGETEGSENKDDEKENKNEISFLELEKELSSMKVVICIGKTGLGKSTFLNRLCGDSSDTGDEGVFEVGHEYKSQTQHVSHKFITLNGCKYCVVDTPGSSDSFGKDDIHTNNIAEYLRGCGGINAFLIFFSLAEPRIDATYTELLKLYSKMLDDNDWWQYVIIVATKYDAFLILNQPKLKKMNDKEKLEYREKRRKEIANFFLGHDELKIPNGIDDLPTVPIGHGNYDDAIAELLQLIRTSKFECKNIKSPIDELRTQLMKSQEKLDKLKAEMDDANTKKTNMKKQVQLCKDAINKA